MLNFLAGISCRRLTVQVPEVLGHVPEAETPLEDFRTEAMDCYNATLERVAGIHQVLLALWAHEAWEHRATTHYFSAVKLY